MNLILGGSSRLGTMDTIVLSIATFSYLLVRHQKTCLGGRKK
jgi:hypothetical protein